MEAQGVDAVILSDAVNIRYATGTGNMQIFSSGARRSMWHCCVGRSEGAAGR
ncbi:MAG: hypothetical protein ACI8RE_003484 [Ilumatobacter sp.]|jgi:hypothetical protein